jgi:choline kinase
MESPLVVILGAGRPFEGTEPSALTRTSDDRRVLDWLLEAFKRPLTDPEIHFVGGYRIEDVVEEYPNIHFSQNEEWAESGPVSSLFTAPLSPPRPVYVCYADTVFDDTAVETLDGTTAVAVDTGWMERYTDRSEESLERAEKVKLANGLVSAMGADSAVDEADAEFTGLFRLSPDDLEIAMTLWEDGHIGPEADIPELLQALLTAGVEIDAVDIGGGWAELETAEDLSRFVLDTKANTLRRLRSMVSRSTILDQITFTVSEWMDNPDDVCARIDASFDCKSVIVRSSTLVEDGWDQSNAGRFESVLDVPVDDVAALTDAIEQVIDSYTDDDQANQVLVQPMVKDIDQSGVVMTRSPGTGSPYYVVNYDATTTSTESVTDGAGEHIQTAVINKQSLESINGSSIPVSDTSLIQYPTDLRLDALLPAIEEIEGLVGYDGLDVEFAIDDDGGVYILQVRPMTIDPTDDTATDAEIGETVARARREFTDSQVAQPGLLGEQTIYGVMPDWNPAEIIGRQPRRLATSLYQYLVMDDIWARQRAEYGYRDVRPHPLMKQFAGQPYVDVRADFNSFIPQSIPDDLARRLVEYYLTCLREHPELHDKVEFEILLTCLPFDYERQIAPLVDYGFTESELEPLREGLREVTRTAYDRIDDDMAEIRRLESRYDRLVDSDLPPLQMVYHLLEDCQRLGTLPFAHLARTAFVATSLLRSLERIGVITEAQRRDFQNSLDTVARQLERDGHRVHNGDLGWEQFVDRYGHLRPGTYEIASPAYAHNPEEFLSPIVETNEEFTDPPDPTTVWDEKTNADVEAELDRIGLPPDAAAFTSFLADAIEGREYAKFVFSRNLSEALERIAAFGEENGFSRADLSHVSVESFFELARTHPPSNVSSWLETRVREGRRRHTITQAVELPPLLFEDTDFDVFERPAREPNFVTNDTVRGETIPLDDVDVEDVDLDGKIVLIEQADPGYD